MTDWLQPNPFGGAQDPNDPNSVYHQRLKLPKWNAAQPLLRIGSDIRKQDCERFFPGMSQAEHERLSRRFARQSREMDERWNREVDAAVERYGDHGALVSGVYRAHFPERVKDRLRSLAHGASRLLDASVLHWKCSGKRMSTWRQELGSR